MDARIQKMAAIIINYSTAVKPGDLVLLRGTSPLAQPLLQALYSEALKAGGSPFVYVHMSNEDLIIMKEGSAAQVEAINPMLKLMYETANVVVRVDADEDTKALAQFPTAYQQARIKAKGGLLNIQGRREGEGSLRR